MILAFEIKMNVHSKYDKINTRNAIEMRLSVFQQVIIYYINSRFWYDSEALAAVETVGFREYNLTIPIVLHDAHSSNINLQAFRTN